MEEPRGTKRGRGEDRGDDEVLLAEAIDETNDQRWRRVKKSCRDDVPRRAK